MVIIGIFFLILTDKLSINYINFMDNERACYQNTFIFNFHSAKRLGVQF